MIKRWALRRGGLLVRNPHFKVWSPDRPDGFPNQIAQRYDRPKAQIAAVDHGAADIALLDPRSAVSLSSGHATARACTPTRLPTPRTCSSTSAPRHSTTCASGGRSTTPSIAAAPPRCSARPRRGSRRARCCRRDFRATPPRRFTANPNRAGIWRGPDLATARRLIAATGTRGMTVEFRGAPWPGWERLNRYFQSLLRDLGYRTRGERHPRTAAPAARGLGLGRRLGRRVQLPQPARLVLGDQNLSRFCDPKLDAQMEEAALASGPEATKKLRRVEAMLAAQAPTVPLANASDIALVAERVGNYQHHPLWGPLIDQLWVK